MGTTEAIELDGQYRLLREEAGWVDRSGRGKLLVTGPDAAEFLQGQLTNEIEALAAGSGCYSALLDRKGHMQADMRVLRLEPERFWIDTEPVATEAVARHLSMYRVGREVDVEDAGGEWTILSVIGPAAHEASGAGPPSPEHAQQPVRGHGVIAVASADGVDLLVPASGADDMRDSLTAAGVVEVSEEAAEILRVESGRPRFGNEMTTETIPQEAGINERAISFTKGCYIGQETVARLHYKGKPNRHLRGLRLSAPAAGGDPIRLGERELGRVGTAVISPSRGPLALAIVRREAAPGDRVEMGERGHEAEIVEVPFA
jgi:tRNA-modifying protein YgfZ